MDAETLLARVKRGEQLSNVELESVRRALADPESDPDPYTLVHILWKSRDRLSRETLIANVSRGLGTASDDGMVRRIVLQALTDLWPSEETFEYARRMLGSDPSPYVRMVAAIALGELGAALPSVRSEAARLLLENFESCEASRDTEWQACYEGLMTLVGVPLAERPLPTQPLRSADISSAVLQRARELARGSGS